MSDWAELQQSLATQSSAALVTGASKIAESLLAYGLDLPTSGKKSMNLATGLKDLKQLLESKVIVPKLPFTDLDYHLMSKIRILHGHTHADRVVINGRLINPQNGPHRRPRHRGGVNERGTRAPLICVA